MNRFNLQETIECPNCNGISILDEGISKIGSVYLTYICNDCRTSFTTTESDTISVNNYHSKVKSFKRKNKIKKILG